MEWKSFVLAERDGKYLLIREAVKKWEGKWFVPGGKADVNETPEMAAHREVWEEAGCRVNLKGIFGIHYRERLFSKRIIVFYAAEVSDDKELKRQADRHSLEARWFGYEEIRKLETRSGLREIIDMYRKHQAMPVENLKVIV
jgi:ADP-ribose pyrophosphatase YjhB (NUDIX family)